MGSAAGTNLRRLLSRLILLTPTFVFRRNFTLYSTAVSSLDQPKRNVALSWNWRCSNTSLTAGVVGLIAGTTLALLKVSLTGMEALMLFVLVLTVLFLSMARLVIPAVISAARFGVCCPCTWAGRLLHERARRNQCSVLRPDAGGSAS